MQTSGADSYNSLCSDVPTTSKKKIDVIRGEEIDITSSSTATSDCDLFMLGRSFVIGLLIGHTFLQLSHLLPLIKSMTLSQDPCRPSSPFEEDGSGRPVVNSKHQGENCRGMLGVQPPCLSWDPTIKSTFHTQTAHKSTSNPYRLNCISYDTSYL